MSVPVWLALSLLTLSAVPVCAQDYRPPTLQQPAAGSPGTATPQPYSQPVPHSLPGTGANSPRLLNPGTGNAGSRLSPPRGNPTQPDRDLPLLQEQRQRNSQGLGGANPKGN